jgi:hypothetical protein
MSWKDIIKAPYDAPRRSKAFTARRKAEEEISATKPKEDLSTDISAFASKIIDPQMERYGRAFVNITKNKDWQEFSELLDKYDKDKLENELGKLYNTKVFITHRPSKGDPRDEDYVIDIGVNHEAR